MTHLYKATFPWIRVSVFLFSLVLFPGTFRAQPVLADRGRSDCAILVPAAATGQELQAAELLQRYLEKSTGCRLPVERTDAATGRDAVVIRQSAEISHPDGYRIRTEGRQLVITGGSHKGCVYGVVELLERYLGCRKYSPAFEVVPRTERLALPEMDISGEPANDLRIVNGAFCADGDYRDWQRLDRVEEVFPEGYYVHTMGKLIPREAYFGTHPEYFALMNGKRITDQPCLSHPDVLRITVATLRREMREQPDRTIWSVSQNDNFSYCQCDDCLRIIDEEGSPSGPVIRFVNAVADSFPAKIISTLAYQYSRQAPVRTKPAGNVQVMLCTIELNRGLPIAEDPSGASFVRDLQAWSRICRNLYLWDYTVNFSHHVSPFPNLHVLQPNLRLFCDHGIRAHFQQSNTGPGHEFSGLKSYLIARLLWDPGLNADSVVTDFLRGYYGAAAPYLQQYIQRLSEALLRTGARLDIYAHPAEYGGTFLSAGDVREYLRLFDLAEQATADDSTRLLHVRTARLPLSYAVMEIGKNDMFGPRGWYRLQDGEFLLRSDMARLPDEFLEVCTRAGVASLNESGLTPRGYYDATLRFIRVSVKGNPAFGKRVTALPPPSAKYSGGDPAVLTNGVSGANDYKVHWLGWEGEDAILTLDLETVRRVDSVRIGTLWDPKSWIFHPVSVACLVSDDGKVFRPVGEARVEGDQRSEEITRTFRFAAGVEPVRYVRFRITGLHQNPAWHPSAGGTCWFFADEIVVAERPE